VNQALVINPPFIEPHRPPISSAILAEIFRLKGYEVSVLDINIELFHALGGDMFYDVQSMFTNNMCSEEQNQYLIEFNNRFLNQKDLEKYEYIAISCFSYWNLKMVEFCCRQIRGIYHGTIIVGGAGLELDNFGKKLRDQNLIDHYIYGEAELAEFSINTKDAIKYDPIASVFVKINPKFYRPAEVDLLLGDSTKARKELGWKPETSFEQLVEKMVLNDLKQIGL